MEYHPDLPPLPDRISRLGELASDLWWVWHFQVRDVFRYIDYPLWRSTAHNPVRMLRLLPRERLEQIAADPEFLSLYDRAMAGLDAARAAQESWWTARFGSPDHRTIAYFSAEFALHQSLPLYAGGLGVLAGDTCKEANDLGLPFVGIGFMYPQGYFHQHVSADGWQLETYERLDWADAPIERALREDGAPCVVAVPLGDRTVLVQVWQVRVGRVRLYLLDTGLDENAPWDRELSARLYGGNQETRIQQEIVLGLGGVRALDALGIVPAVWHLNEGHAAFVVLQRIRRLIEHGSTFDDAVDEVRRTTVFTTHTPVPAGHDAFPFRLVEKHLAGAWGTLGSHRDRFMALGAYDAGYGAEFNMTALALRTAGAVNAVSRLHAAVTERMWAPLRPSLRGPVDPRAPNTVEGPASGGAGWIRTITNGVHVPTWIAPDLAKLFERYLGPDWRDRCEDQAFWDRVREIPDEALWAIRRLLRSHLFGFMRERARQRWTQDRVSAAQVVACGMLLDPDALTIGFARRFAGYKRPDLIFRNPDRLARILAAAKRPVQIVFAGKAHPADDIGKAHLQRVFQRATDPAFGGRVAFVDDYDLHVAHFLVQGCDVWLNNPRKPMEASGTSGMKAAINGVLHLSVGDGWWAEGFTGTNGWLIDGGANPDDHAASDAADAEALYRLLEEQVVPAFYDRTRNGIPTRWLHMVRESIRTVLPRFSTRRMVKEYVEQMYEPALRMPAHG